jgi:cyclase
VKPSGPFRSLAPRVIWEALDHTRRQSNTDHCQTHHRELGRRRETMALGIGLWWRGGSTVFESWEIEMIGRLRISVLLLLVLSEAGYSYSKFVRVEKLSDRVVLAYWYGTHRANLIAVKGQKGLVMIDTEMSPRIMAPIKQAIEETFGRDDWAYVINTHGHMHHAGGNCLFKGAVVVGHDNLPHEMRYLKGRQHKENEPYRLEMAAGRQKDIEQLQAALEQLPPSSTRARRIRGAIEFCRLHAQDCVDAFEVVTPSLTFSDRHTLDLGDLKLELVYFGKGHSLCDILVHVPPDGVLVTAAVCGRWLPRVSERAELQDVERYIRVLGSFLADGVKINRVVPSHSALLTRGTLKNAHDYYQTMLHEIRQAQHEGLTLDQATDRLTVSRKFRLFWNRQNAEKLNENQAGNVERLWQLVEKAEAPG